MKDNYILTAESVTAGHPDKLCDTIADNVLDACLKEDPNARVACEVLATAGKILVAGELRTTASPDVESIVRQVVQNAGYDCNYHVEVRLHTQSPDIAGAVDGDTLGAGDQGIMYGYACWETVELLPAPVVLANRITSLLTTCREEKLISGMGPDGKAQVSVQYAFGVPERVDTIVISCQHDADKDPSTSGEVPEHQAFIYQAAIPALEKLGVPVRVLRSEKTYTSVFMGKVTRGPKKGMIRSFPVCGKCYVQRDCKMHPIRQYQKTLPSNTVQYIGIAKDEPQRLARLGGNQVSLLEKYGYTEDDAKQLCKQAGLLSPVYEFADRGGCWFCPNAKLSELRHLYDHHPDLWQKMMRLQIVPGKVTEKFNRSQTFADIDAMFREWDLQTAA